MMGMQLVSRNSSPSCRLVWPANPLGFWPCSARVIILPLRENNFTTSATQGEGAGEHLTRRFILVIFSDSPLAIDEKSLE